MNLLNNVVTNQYKELEKYATFIRKVSGRNIQIESVISQAYINAVKHTPKSPEEAKAILFHYIRCEYLYTRTASQKEIITSAQFEIDIPEEEEDEMAKIDLMDIVNREVSTWNFIDRGFFKRYMEMKMDKKKVADIANVYGIDYTYTQKKISNLKKKIRCKI